jgi:hypothetical protein
MKTKNWERFTKRARDVLSLAQEEAAQLNQSYIGSEHILIGLLREEGGVAGRVLRELGLNVDRTLAMVERLSGVGTLPAVGKVQLSLGTKRILEIAVDEARRMGQHYISTEHLLLGIARQNEGLAIDVLKRFGINADQIRRQTRRMLKENPVSTPERVGRQTGSRQRKSAALRFIDITQRLNEYSADLIMDAIDIWEYDPVGSQFMLAKAVDTMITYRFWLENVIPPGPKVILSRMEELDPVAGRLVNIFWKTNEPDEKLEVARQLASHILLGPENDASETTSSPDSTKEDED